MHKCPQCGGELVVKHKGHNSFLGCSNFPDCDHTESLREHSEIEPEGLDVPCPKCGKELQLKSGRYGLFVGCSGFPDCDFIAEPDKGDAETLVSCPECAKHGRSGVLQQKTTRRGSTFYACTAYPDCQYSVPLPPVEQACPDCGHPILMIKKHSGITRYVCPQKACNYRSEPV